MTTGTSSRTHSSKEEDTAPVWEVSSRTRKPKWLQETLKKAQELVGNPKRTVKESRPPKRFCSYLVMVSNIREFEPSTFEEAVDQ